jgi:hypothetical protein
MPLTRRPAWLAVAGVLVGLLAARVAWLAWSYYFGDARRYSLESASIAFIAVGVGVVSFRSHNGVHAHAGRPRLRLAWLAIAVAASSFLYAPAFRLSFLSDDYVLRAMANSQGFGVGAGWFFRPVPVGLWRLLLSISSSALPLHALNIVLHGLNAFLVAVLGLQLGMRRETALIGAALFLTFPAAPEAVAWASGLQDVLLTTLALGAVLVASEENASGWRTARVCALLALALGSKETAVAVPALIAICRLSPSRMRHLRDWWLYIALAAVAGTYGVFRVWIGLGAPGYLAAPSRYFVKQLITVAFGTLATPWRSPSSSTGRWLAFLTVVALTLLLTRAFLSWRRTDEAFRRAARLALWTLAAVAPVYTYFYVSPRLEGARYLYLAECGWALLVADLMRGAANRVPKQSLALACAAGTAIVASSITLERELDVWRRAADLRDRVVTEATALMNSVHCPSLQFGGLPDSVDGAYVFRNGFREALGFAGNDTTGAAAGCDFTWNGDRFVPTVARK